MIDWKLVDKAMSMKESECDHYEVECELPCNCPCPECQGSDEDIEETAQ